MDVMRQRNKRNVIYYKKNRVAKKIKKEKHKKAIEDKVKIFYNNKKIQFQNNNFLNLEWKRYNWRSKEN
jgi:hypothetical protein